MNNIYVDELPDYCGNCGFCCKDDLGYWCQAERLIYIADEIYNQKRLQSCPLKLLTEALAEERRKVVTEIKQVLDNKASYSTDADDDWLIQIKESSLYEILEQVERSDSDARANK